ncbi:MAG: hypothetical protein IJ862_05900 [Selenomonadaceae bacterium]|nr:hypothetical protein [Selenomonadaceae bacterium]
MTSMKKKFLTGMLTGALFFVGGLGSYRAFAAECPENINQMPKFGQMGHHGMKSHMPKLSEEQINELSKNIAEKYGLEEAEISQALKDRNNNLHDIKVAAMLAKISGKSFTSVLEMKSNWWQVGEKLGVTSDQVKDFFKQEMAEKLANESSLDTKIIDDLIKDGYNPHDIVIAGKIAKTANKNVKSVLAKKKINNTWSEVAKDFGVDIKEIMPKYSNFKGNHFNRGFGMTNDK